MTTRNALIARNQMTPTVEERWCRVSVERCRKGEGEVVELALNVLAFSAGDDTASSFIRCLDTKAVGHYCELPPFAFHGLLNQIKYDNRQRAEVVGIGSHFVGHQFHALLRLTYANPIAHPAFNHTLHAELLDARSANTLRAPHVVKQRAFEDVCANADGPIYFDSATVDEFSTAGFVLNAGWHAYERLTSYDYREAIFDGFAHNGNKLVQGGRNRQSMILVAHPRMTAKRDVESGPQHVFLCIKQRGGVHVIIPIFYGIPFWRPDRNDADVAHIVSAIRREATRPPHPETQPRNT